MSFLLNASDPETVTAALAFIDAFDSPASSSGSSSDSQQHNGDPEENEAAVGKREKARTERSRAWYSARLRARKKIELLQLQEQVASLELQLKRLRNERCNNGDSRSWLERAANEALNRQRAEEMNAQQKVLLRRLMKDCQALQGMFVNLRGISYSYKSASCCPSSSSLGLSLSSNEATPQLDELRGYLDRMYSDTQVFFAPSRVVGEEYNSQSRRDPSSGDISLQMSSLTPVNCDFKSAGGVFWAGMQMKHKHCWKENVQCLQPSANTVVKSYRVRACNVTGQRTLHGVTCVRKFEERDRVLYVWASAIVPLQRETTNGCELRFRERGWVMLSRAPDNPDQQSVFQTRYEASSEHCGEVSPDNGHFCRNVINLLSSTQRALHEQLEDRASP